MTTEEKLLSVALFDGWEDKGHYIENKRYMIVKSELADSDANKYLTSWDWQITVWAKLCKGVKLSTVIEMGYNHAVKNNKPEHGFDIIFGIIKRINS